MTASRRRCPVPLDVRVLRPEPRDLGLLRVCVQRCLPVRARRPRRNRRCSGRWTAEGPLGRNLAGESNVSGRTWASLTSTGVGGGGVGSNTLARRRLDVGHVVVESVVGPEGEDPAATARRQRCRWPWLGRRGCRRGSARSGRRRRRTAPGTRTTSTSWAAAATAASTYAGRATRRAPRRLEAALDGDHGVVHRGVNDAVQDLRTARRRPRRSRSARSDSSRSTGLCRWRHARNRPAGWSRRNRSMAAAGRRATTATASPSISSSSSFARR